MSPTVLRIRRPIRQRVPYRSPPSPPHLPLGSSPVTLGTGSTIYPAELGPCPNFATRTLRPTGVWGAHPRDMDAPDRTYLAYVTEMSQGRLRFALRRVLSISRLGNQRMQSAQPWILLKGTDEDKIRGATTIGLCCQIAALLCAVLSPYMPVTARQLAKQLNVDIGTLRINPDNPSLLQYLPRGHVINQPSPLFSKLEPDSLETLRTKYAGTQSEREGKKNDAASVAALEEAIAKQGEKVRQLKASTKDKSVWQPEVNVLLDLKKQLTAAQAQAKSAPKPSAAAGTLSVAQLEDAIAKQGEKVRQLKASTKDKAVWTPEVNILLDLKKQLTAAQAQAKTQTAPAAVPAQGASVAQLEEAVAKQGEKVRQLKASTKDKAVWTPEVNILLDLKKQLTAAQAQAKSSAPAAATAAALNGASAADLEAAIAKQGDKVRQLKASTKDKSVWQPEVNVLLDLKKQLAALQVK
ncbi:unnamed protein product [Plutella xylostella]|uniref:(diamondback moth) hypothetical protein n=1 Tax=Plutella xylostella TaxID=51655 RepID=A0A8S4G312_PLUXY|nr:unnamed protein product [Plutella xylostella]